MAQQSTEDRLAMLEKEVAELKRILAERRPLDELRADMRNLQTGQSELRAHFQAHEEYVTDRLNDFEAHVTTRIDLVEDHLTAQLHEQAAQLHEQKESIGKLQEGQLALQSGQDQILAILTRTTKTND